MRSQINNILVGRDARYGTLVTDRGTFENYQLRLEARINAWKPPATS